MFYTLVIRLGVLLDTFIISIINTILHIVEHYDSNVVIPRQHANNVSRNVGLTFTCERFFALFCSFI